MSKEEDIRKKTKEAAQPEKTEQAATKPKREAPAKKKAASRTKTGEPAEPEELVAQGGEAKPTKVAAKEKQPEETKAPKKKSKAAAKREEEEAKAMKEKGLQALKEYVFLGVTMEELAGKYGFSSWEELYELYKKTPASEIWAQ